MHFCTNCENMLYIRLMEEKSDKLIYYCRNCGSTDQLIENNNICVSKLDITTKESLFLQDINEYTKLDPTLPRINHIKCPEQNCESNKGGKNEVIYLRYDDKNMQYIYICAICDKIWKTSEK